MSRQRTFFVAGATGKQGGALARQLLTRGQRVRAYTRNPGAPPARLLQRLGAELHGGGFDDLGPLTRALRGCDGAFAMASFVEAGVAAELQHASNLFECARAAGLRHVVYASMAGADHVTGVPHIDSKGEAERRLARAGVPYTIVAPVFFMENWLTVLPTAAARGSLGYPLPADRVLQQIAVDDVASFVRTALEHPAEFENRRVEIAGDALPMQEVAATLAASVGRALAYRAIPLESVWTRSELLGRLCAWLDWEGTHVDVDRLRARYRDVGWTRFETWARRQDWGAVLAPPVEPAAVEARAWVAGAR